MKTYKIVFIGNDYYPTNWVPFMVLEDFNKTNLDINEKIERFDLDCRGNFFVENRYCIRELKLPNWFDISSIIKPTNNVIDHHAFKDIYGFTVYGGDIVDTLNHKQYKKLISLKDYPKYGDNKLVKCLRLLKTKKFRSSFRKSLYDQLVNWLNTENSHKEPFSEKQWYYIYNKDYPR